MLMPQYSLQPLPLLFQQASLPRVKRSNSSARVLDNIEKGTLFLDKSHIAFDRRDNRVHPAGQDLFGKAKSEAFDRMERSMRRQG